MTSFGERVSKALSHGWSAFTNQDVSRRLESHSSVGVTYGPRPDRGRTVGGNERSIITSIYTRMAIDIAALEIRHIRLDNKNRYKDDMDSGLNYCLTVRPNLDQGPRHFRQDIVSTLFNHGVAAIVPVEATLSPEDAGGWDAQQLRVGEVKEWHPDKVGVEVYNEKTGRREMLILKKAVVAIVENPLYEIMNEPNSTLKRLTRKLALLDKVDEHAGSGNLDLIVQLPYVVRSEARKETAQQRIADIQNQLRNSTHGIAYTDGTEKITQLNRPVENKLLKQIEYLQKNLYNELGLSEEVMNGTADPKTMLNYRNRAIRPVADAMVEAMRPKFLTKTAISQKQWIDFFGNPFALVTIEEIAEIADKFTRNEITTSNEIRQVVGMRPIQDPKADELRNSNMPQSELGAPDPSKQPVPIEPKKADDSEPPGDPASSTTTSREE